MHDQAGIGEGPGRGPRLSQTQRYTHVTQELIKNAAARMAEALCG